MKSMMISRWWLIIGLWMMSSCLIGAEAVKHGKFLGAKDTVYPDWFKTSFLDFADDVAEAAENGRRVMMIFHQDNCPYCNVLVERNLSQKNIEDVIKEKFDVVAINMWGDREVATVDGQSLTEKAFARVLNVQFTPTIIVLNEKGGLALRLNGYIPPAEFSLALEYASTHNSPNGYREFLVQQGVAKSEGTLVASDVFLGTALTLPPAGTKPVALVFEQRDCPACENLHGTVLNDSTTKDLLARFDTYQLDMWSQEQELTLEGKPTTARELADHYGVKYAPTMVLLTRSGKEVIRAEAMFKAFHTQSMLDYVEGGHYEAQPDFQRYLSERAEAIRATGKDVNIWE